MSSRIMNGIIVAIKGFEVLIHVLGNLGFEILNLSRGATVNLIINLNGDLFHGFKLTLKSVSGQDNHPTDYFPLVR